MDRTGVGTKEGTLYHCRTLAVPAKWNVLLRQVSYRNIHKDSGPEREDVRDDQKHTIETSLGAVGLAQLKAGIEASLGHEINWNESDTKGYASECQAPKCGRSELAIYELIRDHDVVVYERGFHLFRSNVWDLKSSCTVPEATGRYAAVECESVKWDERCHCPVKEPELAYDGRLSINLGKLSLLAPYAITKDELKIRIMSLVITFPLLKPATVSTALQQGIKLPIDAAFLHPALLFFAELEGDAIDADTRIYQDAGTRIFESAEIHLQLPASIQDIGGQPGLALP